MFIVTGGAGFIGSNIVKKLNQRGISDILVVDNLEDGRKFKNLANLNIADYLDKKTFLELLLKEDSLLKGTEVIFHQGACSKTTEWDGRFMMDNNYTYSKALLHYCLNKQTSFLYASSAATYGGGQVFKEERACEEPLNVYGYSKFQFDQYVRRVCKDITAQVVGFRYFNVYGPRETHKDSMASVAFHFNNQIKAGENLKLFEGSDGFDAGEQRRDFVYVEDVVDVNLWFYDNPTKYGIYNVGTGRSQSFNDVAKSVISWHQKGEISYIPFPEHLKGRYQSFTQADISKLRGVGYNQPFKTVEQGVKLYLDEIEQNAK